MSKAMIFARAVGRCVWQGRNRFRGRTLASTASARALPVTALYAGSFDPPSLGHLDVIERALKTTRCDKLIVSVAVNPLKKYVFSTEERVEFLESE